MARNAYVDPRFFERFQDGITIATALRTVDPEELVEESDLSEVPVGPDPEVFLEAIAAYEKAGYDHVTLHQVGKEDAFIEFAARSLILGSAPPPRASSARGRFHPVPPGTYTTDSCANSDVERSE